MKMITPSVFRWMAICQRRVWRDVNLDPTLRDKPPMQVVAARDAGVQHEHLIQQTVAPQVPSVNARNWAEGIQITKRYMADKQQVIHGAYLEVEIVDPLLNEPIKLGGRTDFLALQENGLYAPLEVKQYEVARDEDKLQLSFYVWMLCKIQNVRSLPATFLLGAGLGGQPKKFLPYEANLQQFEKLLESALFLINSPEPSVSLMQQCENCHWRSSCFSDAVTSNSITLLSNLQRSTREDFKKHGIETLEQITAMQPEDLYRFRGIKTTAFAIHASARAWVEKSPVWYNLLPAAIRSTPVYFDIETETMRGSNAVWSIGWAVGEGPVQVVVVDPNHPSGTLLMPRGESIMLVPDADSAWRYFAQSVQGSDTPIFHWSAYDKTNLTKYAPLDVRDSLSPRLQDLCHLFNQSVKLPVRGVSLKTVGPYFGFTWQGYDDFQWAYIDYQRWLRRNNIEGLDSAITYQRNDISAMMIIRQWLLDNAPDVASVR